MDHGRHTYSGEVRQVFSSEVGRRKVFTEILRNEGGKRYTITLKAKNSTQ